MRGSGSLKVLTCLCLLASACSAEAVPMPTGMAARIEAERIAGTEKLKNQALVLCDPNPDRTAADRLGDLPPTQIFDDFYFVGTRNVSAWLWKSASGFVLIDTLDNADEAQAYIVNGMIRLGIAPEQVRWIVITHGHSDHSGGASGLTASLPNARIAMSEQAYRVAVQAAAAKSLAFPQVNLTLKDGENVLGMKVVETPGHSPGTISLIFPLHIGSSRHVASLFGGSASFRLSAADLEAYSASTRRFAVLAQNAGVDFVVSNHAMIDQTKLWIDQVTKGSKPAPLSSTEVRDYYRVVDFCARSHIKW